MSLLDLQFENIKTVLYVIALCISNSFSCQVHLVFFNSFSSVENKLFFWSEKRFFLIRFGDCLRFLFQNFWSLDQFIPFHDSVTLWFSFEAFVSISQLHFLIRTYRFIVPVLCTQGTTGRKQIRRLVLLKITGICFSLN